VAERRTPRKLRIIGSDRDPERAAEVRENADAAGCGDWIEVETADARRFAPRAGWNAWIVSNLPYGQRIGEARRLRPLMAAFGATVREHCAGYRFAFLSGRDDLWQALELPGARCVDLLNGGIEIRLWLGEVEP
jgi:23S rRNA G2445 N2-methylase RlmL